uniref:Uncharacterized protein n=1 Tax=Anguilla anguilla TaxID=7936 RepID=A0A0E9QGA0_ANGAN
MEVGTTKKKTKAILGCYWNPFRSMVFTSPILFSLSCEPSDCELAAGNEPVCHNLWSYG